MTNLRCEAKNCIHNDSKQYCCISHICVGGADAVRDVETCCDDFRDKKQQAINGCCDSHKNPQIDIECKAVNCVYNEECRCHAADVQICGSSACVCDETCCGTFRTRG